MLNTLFSLVQNVSGNTRFFGYLGPHGMKLADDAQASIPGDINTVLAVMDQVRGCSTRRHKGFQNDLTEGRIAYISAPLLVMYDETAEATVQLAIDDATLGTIELKWDA